LLGFVAAQRVRLGTLSVPFQVAQTARRTDALVARIGTGRMAELWDEGYALDPMLVREWFVE